MCNLPYRSCHMYVFQSARLAYAYQMWSELMDVFVVMLEAGYFGTARRWPQKAGEHPAEYIHRAGIVVSAIRTLTLR